VQLYNAVEERGAAGDPVEAAKLVQRFLCCAEERYTKYLTLVDEFTLGFNKDAPRSLRDAMPLPPWYVSVYLTLNPFVVQVLIIGTLL